MPYTVQITDLAEAELAHLPKRDRKRIEARILSLASNPYPAGVVALKGKRFKGLHRIRSGNYRIIYQVQDTRLLIIIVKIGDRKEVYE